MFFLFCFQRDWKTSHERIVEDKANDAALNFSKKRREKKVGVERVDEMLLRIKAPLFSTDFLRIVEHGACSFHVCSFTSQLSSVSSKQQALVSLYNHFVR